MSVIRSTPCEHERCIRRGPERKVMRSCESCHQPTWTGLWKCWGDPRTSPRRYLAGPIAPEFRSRGARRTP